MFCSNCGAEVHGKFCSNCGAPVSIDVKETTVTTPVVTTGLSEEDTALIPIFAQIVSSKKPTPPEIKRLSVAMREYNGKNVFDSPKFVFNKIQDPIFMQAVMEYKHKIGSDEDDNRVRCPRCGSKDIKVTEKGFGFGKAAAGGCLLGPLGLLFGGFGRKQSKLVCQNCGNRFTYNDATRL